MSLDRRAFLAASVAAATAACQKTISEKQSSSAAQSASKLGIPGPYPGRVVAIQHPNSIVQDQYQAEPVRQMLERA